MRFPRVLWMMVGLRAGRGGSRLLSGHMGIVVGWRQELVGLVGEGGALMALGERRGCRWGRIVILWLWLLAREPLRLRVRIYHPRLWPSR